MGKKDENKKKEFLLTRIDKLDNCIHELETTSNLTSSVNWVLLEEQRPKCKWGNFLVCLENKAILEASYSSIKSERWWIIGVGEITNENPVKYWAELPGPPILEHD